VHHVRVYLFVHLIITIIVIKNIIMLILGFNPKIQFRNLKKEIGNNIYKARQEKYHIKNIGNKYILLITRFNFVHLT
jgi:hypothetical protein